jgi:hypothetical protein
MTSDYKNATIRNYAKNLYLQVLVETGTCFGDAIAGVREAFEEIYSIELSSELYEGARERFVDDFHVHLFQGDSAIVLPTLLPHLLSKRCLFWLDAHYSGGVTARGPIDTPIVQELDAIFRCCWEKYWVLLIDDADCFTGTGGYPTLDTLERSIKAKAPHSTFILEENIIRIL